MARVQPSASSLFEQASALRARGRLDDSVTVFRKLQQLFPRSRECRLSYALVGRMLLDRGRPAQALAQFDQHLAQEGEASEEALAGRATALGEMGRVSAERESWQRLLGSYPKSVYASQARDRLFQMRRLEEVFPAGDPSR
jgi:tetratricopeptide (TPR) repeat protein